MALIIKLTIILFAELVALSLIVTYKWIDLQSVATLLIFDFLFLTLFTQLNGEKTAKLSLLVAGNALGMLWNYVFHNLMIEATLSKFISPIHLSVFYTVAYPFLNSFWVIAFWSISLSVLKLTNISQG